jgi:hypothetical protein
MDIHGFNKTQGELTIEGQQYNSSFLLTPTVVPLPAAAWLFGSGLLGLAGMARRKRV